MASVTVVARVSAGVLLLSAIVRASDVAVPSTYTSLPTEYSLSYDKDKWTEEFSVFHMAVTDPHGTFGSDFATSDDPRLKPLTRLDSSWVLSAPLLTLPMRVGDGVSSAGLWDQPARIGGVQIGTFQPKLPEVLTPPSVVAEPFELGTFAAGTAGVGSPGTLATNHFIDHLRGLVQIQSQSLATSGQGTFSMESGRLRENFEVRSDDYGPWITSGTYRYGISDATTVDGEVAQVAGQQSVVGLGVLEGLGPLGLVSAKIASSRDPDSTGWLARMGYDLSGERFSVALRSHIQSPGYLEVGDVSTTEPYRQRTLASARVDLGSLGKISLASATETTYTDDNRHDIIALSHAMPFGGGGIVSTAAAYSPGSLGSSALLLSFTYPFDYVAAPAHRTSAVNSALDRTIVDAFGQTRIPASSHPALDRAASD